MSLSPRAWRAHLACLSIAGLAASSLAQSPCPTDVERGENSPEDRFGYSIALDGTDLIVGSPRDDTDGTDAGGVYRFSTNNNGISRFEERWPGVRRAGTAVAIDSGWAAYDLDTSEVVTYRRISNNNWEQVRLFATGSTSFGDALAINGGTSPRVAIADFFTQPAAIRVFVLVSGVWLQEDTLLPNDSPTSLTSVAMLNGTTVLAGAPTDGASGAVYVFQRNGGVWSQVQKITAPQAPNGARFGHSLDVDGNTLVVGAPRWGNGQINVYRRNSGTQWNLEGILFGQSVDELGADVSVSGERVAACSAETGEVALYERSGTSWFFTSEVQISSRTNAVDFEGTEFYGADFGSVTEAGRVYGGIVDGTDCDNDGTPDACEIFSGEALDQNANGVPDDCECQSVNFCTSVANSTGNSALIGRSGSESISANDFAFEVQGAGANRPGLFFYGSGQIQVPFGDGFRCVGAGGVGTVRLNPPVATDGTGSLTRAFDLSSPPATTGIGQIGPFSTWNFQFWFRDPMGPGGSGFNLTNGMSVTFCP